MSGQEDPNAAIVDLTQDDSSPPYAPDAHMMNADASSDIEEIVMEDAAVDEGTRQRNIENRRQRLARGGINERAERGRDRPRQRPWENEVIVISDNDDNGNSQDEMDVDGDRFGGERRRRRAAQLERDILNEGWRYPETRPRPLPVAGQYNHHHRFADLLHPPLRLHTPSPPPPPPPLDGRDPVNPGIRLGGGGFITRGNPDPFNRHGVRAQSMHRRSLELDNERIQERQQQHINDLIMQQEMNYPGLLDGFIEAFGRVTNRLNLNRLNLLNGWGAAAFNQDEDNPRPRPVRAPPIRVPREEPLNLAEAPEYELKFTHPNWPLEGFTHEFAPVEPRPIALDEGDNDDDDEYDPLFDSGDPEAAKRRREKWRRRKGKGKAPIRAPVVEVERKPLGVVCSLCKDPLVIGGNEDQKLYGLRCGHVLDGKCVWKLGVPPPIVPPPSIIPDTTMEDVKGKGKAKQEEANAAGPSFNFTFTLPPKPAQPLGEPNIQYEEDNDPDPAFILPSVRSRLRARRELIPTPMASRKRQGRRRPADGLDNIDDDLPSEGHLSTSTLNLVDPFFPILNNPPSNVASTSRAAKKPRAGYARRGKAHVAVGSHGLRVRLVGKRWKQKEEIYEWKCPVEGCGRVHLSVRLDIEGAKWRCDDDAGAKGMFL